jgi:hypothetical protein
MWASLGAKTGYAPKPAEDTRQFIVGPPGEGKTTYVSGSPDTLILDFESGAEGIPGSKAVRIHVKSHEHYMEILVKLVEQGKVGKHEFKRIVWDTVDELAGMESATLAKEKGVENIVDYGAKGHGWSLLRTRCWSPIYELQQLGYIWTCVGHMSEKTVTHPVTHKEVTVIRASVFPGLAGACRNNAEIYATIYCIVKEVTPVRVVTVQGQRRELPDPTKPKETVKTYMFDCASSVNRQGKSRGVTNMKSKFELPLYGGWGVFVKEYSDAISKLKGESK